MSKDLTWPTERMAKFIDLTPRRLQQLVQEGVIPKSEGRGRYNPFTVVVSYIRFLRDRAPDGESNNDMASEKLGRLRAQRELLELQVSKEKSGLISRVKVREDGIRIGAIFDAELSALLNDMPGVLAGLKEIKVRDRLAARFSELKNSIKREIARVA